MADGSLFKASFANPMGIAADENGNLYVADSHNNIIRKIDSSGIVSTLAGNGKTGSQDGNANQASFFYPVALFADHQGNIFVSDTHNNLIRKIDAAGTVSTVVGKDTSLANERAEGSRLRLDNPAAISVDRQGNIYIADWGNNVIRRIGVDAKCIVLAGSVGQRGSKDGFREEASFYLPWGIVLDSVNNIYVSDFRNNLIRKISPQGQVTTFAGSKTRGSTDGQAEAASFFHPAGLAIDKKGNIYVADTGNNKIRKITPEGLVTTLAGDGSRGASNGPAHAASFNKPYALAVGPDGSIFIADYQNNLIRKVSFH